MSSSTATGATSWAALFRLSLRELLLLVAMVAIAIASMKYASTESRTCVYTITMAIFMGAAVVAAVDRGPRQAFAIGMVLLMLIYGVLVTNGATSRAEGNREMHPESGRLPTSRIVNYLFPPTVTFQWFDRRSRQPLLNFDPAKPPPGVTAYRQGSIDPDPGTLMAIAPLLVVAIAGVHRRTVCTGGLSAEERPAADAELAQSFAAKLTGLRVGFAAATRRIGQFGRKRRFSPFSSRGRNALPRRKLSS